MKLIVKILALAIVIGLGVMLVKNIGASAPTGAVTTAVSQFEGRNDVQEFVLSFGETNYEPSTFEVESGKPVRLVVDTDKVKGCFASIKIPELKVSKSLTPADNLLEFLPEEPGEYAFGCAMGMGAGKIIVK